MLTRCLPSSYMGVGRGERGAARRMPIAGATLPYGASSPRRRASGGGAPAWLPGAGMVGSVVKGRAVCKGCEGVAGRS